MTSNLDRELQLLFATEPRIAPARVIGQALAEARSIQQRRPRITRIGTNAWPAPRWSLGDPPRYVTVRMLLVAALAVGAFFAAAVVGTALIQRSLFPPRPLTTSPSPTAAPTVDPEFVLTGTWVSVDRPGVTLVVDPVVVGGPLPVSTIRDKDGAIVTRDYINVTQGVLTLVATGQASCTSTEWRTYFYRKGPGGGLAIRGPAAGGAPDPCPERASAYLGGWSPTAPPPQPRLTSLESAAAVPANARGNVALLLSDGRILTDAADGLAMIVDPSSGASSTVGPPNPERSLMAGALLGDGRVLLLSWENIEPVEHWQSAAWVVDPAAATAVRAGDMTVDWSAPSIATLSDGRVVVIGGLDTFSGETTSGSPIDAFDPVSLTFGRFPLLEEAPRNGGTIIPLADGRLLLAGGSRGIWTTGAREVVVYDPESARSAVVGMLDTVVFSRYGVQQAQPVSLPDGRVLIPGPNVRDTCGRERIEPAAAYLFDPATDGLAPAPPFPHQASLAIALPDGRAVLAGGWLAIDGGCGGSGERVSHNWLAVYDPVTGVVLESKDPFTGLASLPIDEVPAYTGGALLPDGRVALVGDGVIDLLTVGTQ